MSWFLVALNQYAVFEGRARRKEFWLYHLFYGILYVISLSIDIVAGTLNEELGFGVFSAVLGVALLPPTLGVSVRRLHDTGRSGWWYLVGVVPIIGGIVFLVFMVQDGQPGDNRFGANPKESVEARTGSAEARGRS